MPTSLRNAVAYALTIPPHSTSVRSAVAYALTRDPGVPAAPNPIPSDLRKSQRQLLYDLIEESNPGFQTQFPLDKLDFGTPSAITVDPTDPYKRDTQVAVSAKANSGFMGNKTVRYRRIDIGVLFRNMTMQVNLYDTKTSLLKADWIPALNFKYGLSLVPDDIPASNIGNLPGTGSYGMSIVATSLCYKATVAVQLQWIPGKRPMLDMIPDAKQVLVGRSFPVSNDFSDPTRKPIGEWETYGIDASELKTTLEALAASTVVAADSAVPAVTTLINWLKYNSGKDYFTNKDSTVKGGLGGLTWYKYTLPNASVPEANSARFNRVIVIQGVAGSWFSGKILLHYNV